MTRVATVFIVTGLIVSAGCGPSGPPKLPKGVREKVGDAVPVTGQLLVDGSPGKGVSILALNEKDLEEETGRRQQNMKGTRAATGVVNPEGKFSFSTYQNGDGLPAGNYIIFFEMYVNRDEKNPKADKFKKKYSDPTKSILKITVEKGKPVDMGKVELTSS